MARNVVTISVWQDSDGTNAPAKDTTRSRNDAYFEEKLADLWMKERRQNQPGVIYKLDRLPTGYSGWEKRRGDTKHVDRYMSGHPSGKDFRSLNEAWPHFQHLIINGGPIGCQCLLCTGGRKKPKSEPSHWSHSPSGQSRFFGASTSLSRSKSRTRKTQNTFGSDSDYPKRSKQADEEGIPDYYRILLDKVKAAGPNGQVRESVIDQLSPDWRAGHQLLQETLNEWQQQPSFVPRIGELVLFVRSLEEEDKIVWDSASKLLRPKTLTGWLDDFRWEAGVVTQLPTEAVGQGDLSRIPSTKIRNVIYSGFRIEPLSEPGNQSKPFTSQHKYVPLHMLRPFSCWRDCLGGSDEHWHPTVKHALTVASSWSLLGKYSFVGAWPEATLFCRGIYLGPELVMMGDLIRLEPRPRDARQDTITDVMAVSSIRLRFVKLDEASDDDYDNGQPYTTCLHIAGKVYTTDPKRSHGGIGASPARPGHDEGLPPDLAGYGIWFHVTDPQNARQKLEVPYTRVLGRCLDQTALQQWYSASDEMTASSSLSHKRIEISEGLAAMREAKEYSRQHDSRIDTAGGQSWYWAESRIEQLDLHEINGRFVGPKDDGRDRKQVNAWKHALKVLDGKMGALDDYFAAKKVREEEQKHELATSSAYGMLASAPQPASAGDDDAAEDDEAGEDDEAAEADDVLGTDDAVEADDAMEMDEGVQTHRESPREVISLDSDGDEEDELMILD